ncbi:hypothetical protein [Paraburkholderia dioscoreae]|uniref:Uncharacterized protein n=1 Tax=Paraburkholderia dioscoreae TaxID=2604047 RepID=A0A5Q4ZHQ2_9BURK|nr:hypothetical protein [Paraburkholderia dioscoreae]VVD30907.1 conserved protein of unknown function [Paraburkholderia dioscoreae]
MEGLESFGLPETFPADLMPATGAQFIKDCIKGMDRTTLTRIARERGFMPTWKRLTHLGPGVYGFSLTIDRMGVPLMVRMSEAAPEQRLDVRTPEQQSLF